MTGAAGLGNIERVHRRPLVVLGEDGMRVTMTAGAGMLDSIGVDAVAGMAVYSGLLVT